MISTGSLNSSERAVCVAQNRLDSEFVQKEAKGSKFQTSSLEKSLNDGDWMPLMKTLWSDEEGTQALRWLRDKEKDFLPVLLYEQSMLEYLKKPTLETASRISIPLIVTATLSLRVQQSFVLDEALVDVNIANTLEEQYLENLNQLIGRVHKTSLAEMVLLSDCSMHILDKVKEFSQKKDLPKQKTFFWLIRDPAKAECFQPIEGWRDSGDLVVQRWVQEWTPGASSLRFFERRS